VSRSSKPTRTLTLRMLRGKRKAYNDIVKLSKSYKKKRNVIQQIEDGKIRY
ncbi:18729_t:CDS:1, partial [Funneliformis geosporum]